MEAHDRLANLGNLTVSHDKNNRVITFEPVIYIKGYITEEQCGGCGASLLGQVVRHSVFWCNSHQLVTEKCRAPDNVPHQYIMH